VLTRVTVIATYLLVVVGGLVRVSNSGLGCPDWPLCHGHAVPLAQLRGATLIEFSHRAVSAIATVLILATALFSWRRYRHEKWVFRPAVLAVVLLCVQILLGGVTVLLELPPLVVSVHLTNALLILAALVVVAVSMPVSNRPSREQAAGVQAPAGQVLTHQAAYYRPSPNRLRLLATVSTLGTLVLIVSGTVVVGTASGGACYTSWPLCNGQVLPSDGNAIIHMLHRYVAAGVGLLIAFTLVYAWRSSPHVRAVRMAALASALLFAAQIIVGTLNVLLGFPLVTGIMHLAIAAAVWVAMVVFATFVYQTNGAHAEPPMVSPPERQLDPARNAGQTAA
jgi:heme A synthase